MDRVEKEIGPVGGGRAGRGADGCRYLPATAPSCRAGSQTASQWWTCSPRLDLILGWAMPKKTRSQQGSRGCLCGVRRMSLRTANHTHHALALPLEAWGLPVLAWPCLIRGLGPVVRQSSVWWPDLMSACLTSLPARASSHPAVPRLQNPPIPAPRPLPASPSLTGCPPAALWPLVPARQPGTGQGQRGDKWSGRTCPATGESPSFTSSRHRPHRFLPLPANETIAFFTGCSRLHRATPHLGLCRETRRVLLAWDPWRADDAQPPVTVHCSTADWAPRAPRNPETDAIVASALPPPPARRRGRGRRRRGRREGETQRTNIARHRRLAVARSTQAPAIDTSVGQSVGQGLLACCVRRQPAASHRLGPALSPDPSPSSDHVDGNCPAPAPAP